MNRKNKIKINWNFLIAGLIVLSVNLFRFQESNTSQFKKLNVHLSTDALKNSNNKSPADYIFRFEGYENQFSILKGFISTKDHEKISKLRKGQQLTIYIDKDDYKKRSERRKNSIIAGLSIEGIHYIKPTPKEMDSDCRMYEIRVLIFNIFIIMMLFLNSLVKFPKKINYLLIGLFIGVIIFMRIFDFGIY